MSEIYKALAEAQKDIKSPSPDKKGQAGSRKYGYQTLASVLDAVLPPCNKQGLFITQRIDGSGDSLCLITEACKDDDKVELCCYPLTYLADAQKFGSAVTYAKRYSLLGVFGVACKDDDDGAATIGMQPAKQKPKAQGQDRAALFAAAERLKKAIADYADAIGGDTKKMHDGVKKRPDFENTVEFYTQVASEFEQEAANKSEKVEF
jgi:hypothetical protein